MLFCANKTHWNTDRSSVLKSYEQCNESLKISANEELSKFKDSVIEEFNALKSSFLAEVDSYKNRHLNSCGNGVLVENSEHLKNNYKRT